MLLISLSIGLALITNQLDYSYIKRANDYLINSNLLIQRNISYLFDENNQNYYILNKSYSDFIVRLDRIYNIPKINIIIKDNNFSDVYYELFLIDTINNKTNKTETNMLTNCIKTENKFLFNMIYLRILNDNMTNWEYRVEQINLYDNNNIAININNSKLAYENYTEAFYKFWYNQFISDYVSAKNYYIYESDYYEYILKLDNLGYNIINYIPNIKISKQLLCEFRIDNVNAKNGVIIIGDINSDVDNIIISNNIIIKQIKNGIHYGQWYVDNRGFVWIKIAGGPWKCAFYNNIYKYTDFGLRLNP